MFLLETISVSPSSEDITSIVESVLNVQVPSVFSVLGIPDRVIHIGTLDQGTLQNSVVAFPFVLSTWSSMLSCPAALAVEEMTAPSSLLILGCLTRKKPVHTTNTSVSKPTKSKSNGQHYSN